MISFLLDVDDLADTRFAISPLREVMGSLRALRAPGLYPCTPHGAGRSSHASTPPTPGCCGPWSAGT
ncbi:hypothetical protein WKI71_39720 [Streptomyces sp. MS1.AVA.1]|uniref:Uncharacterized protein n=1 Tax=Streptomyces machairae TaxID=3134109 RepID=A0ABU8UTM8_9ACTN